MSLMGGNSGAGMDSIGSTTKVSDDDALCANYPLTYKNVECLPAPKASQIALSVVLGSLGVAGYIGIIIFIIVARKQTSKSSSNYSFSFNDLR